MLMAKCSIMMSAASLLYHLLVDAIAYARLLLRSSNSQAAEILFLRKQLALYQERNAPRNPTDPLLVSRWHYSLIGFTGVMLSS